MLKVVPKRLFPLHLPPIDEFFIADDRPDYPMTFASNLFFTGEFQRAAFEAAMWEALELHPLLHALVQPAKQNKPCWVAAKECPLAIDWGSPERAIDLERCESINLAFEPGLRIWVRQGNNAAHLVLQFHHACCDGTGAHRFMGDLLAAYGSRTSRDGQRPPEVANYDVQLLKQRRMKLADSYVYGDVSTNVRRGLGTGMHVFGRRIAPLSTTGLIANESEQVEAVPGVVSYKFDRHEHKQLREAAGRHGVTLNDLLMAEMFQTMRQWNLSHGSSKKQRLRIMMPSDMRGKADYAMPAANMTSYNFVTRHMRECLDEEALVRGIRDETALIKHEQRGRLFIDSIMLAKRVPGLMPFLLSGRRCLTTVTVSHMGDPTRRFLATFPRKHGKLVCGDVILEDMVGVSPLRPQTRAAVSIVTLYRELAINVRCDPRTMTLGDSKELLDNYAGRLERHLQPALVAEKRDSELVTA